MKRVLVSGATGCIGRHCLPSLSARGYEIHAVSSRPRLGVESYAKWHQVDLLESRQIPDLLSRVQPTHLLHLAWYMVPGESATSSANYRWVQASLELLRQFCEHGGKRVVMAGSSFEYDWNYGYCSEFTTPKVPSTFYGVCKDALHSLVDAYSKHTGLSSAWARIFFLYGPHEHPERLVPSVIRSLLRGEPARCSHGNQIRDYLHVQDIADALVALLESSILGPVNVASGQPIALKDIVYKVAQKIGREDLLHLGALPSRPNDLPLVVADIGRLSDELAWKPTYNLDRGLEQTIRWWKEHLNNEGNIRI